ncbi:protein POLLEN DEFECTIVE IN GUIDANCE 1 [Silene latifolia]|uniref:protein POLLEN DEFECTIVE IN GUIDANCE 1 n=1 Tax=Silene latifolia TaxID=37657 RepID=UPI003D76C54B
MNCSSLHLSLRNSSNEIKMGLRSKGKQLSFEILSSMDDASSSSLMDRSISDPFPLDDNDYPSTNTRSRRRRRKKKNNNSNQTTSSPMFPIAESSTFAQNYSNTTCYTSLTSTSTTTTSTLCEESESGGSVYMVSQGELRQRSVGGGSNGETTTTIPVYKEETVDKDDSALNSRQTNGISVGMNGRKLETSESLDWRQLIPDHPSDPFPVENSPIKYFMEEMSSGNSLRSTTTPGDDKERERVYDTIFRLPWRCELLIDVGFFVCLNSFLSLLTIIPSRAAIILWRSITRRQLKKLSAAELSDFGCILVLAGGIVLLGRTDISLIYHMIRGQGIIKLYVVYNVLEIFDKLWQSFGGDVFQTFFNSAEGLACCSPESSRYWIERYSIDLLLAAASSIIHSFILLVQAITLSTCIVAHNNALFALLVSNNFAEIKSNVFKRFSKDNVHSIVYSDSIERFHITAFVIFVLAQNIQEAEGSWFGNFISNALLVYLSEMAIDIIKHSFIAKFNDIKPITYSEFLEDLCKQTLNIQTDVSKRTLTFVPLAPACVVIRVLTPVYAARLPCNPIHWRFFWIFCLIALTYVMLVTLKVMVGMGLQKHAAWYVKRCQNRKLHSD